MLDINDNLILTLITGLITINNLFSILESDKKLFTCNFLLQWPSYTLKLVQLNDDQRV